MTTKTTNQIMANKYKPYYLNDFHIDDKTTSIIRTLLDIEDLNLLFIANTGSGKTALLYAILREYYGLSKNATISENNIMFINNLKEQGINYFRNEMKTFCQSQCSIYGKKKIIVIDDIDTINEQSQQVFRNYIDKYKSNIHFISSCTNVQKVIESIQSRLHIINIHFQPEKQMRDLIARFIADEGISIDAESCDFILQKSENNVRRLLSHLEKIAIYGKPVELEICEKLCTTLSFHSFEKYIQILTGNRLVLADTRPGESTLTFNPLVHLHQEIPGIMQSTIPVKGSTRFIGRVPADTRPGESTLNDISLECGENPSRVVEKMCIMDAVDILLAIHDYGYSAIDIYDYFYSFIKQTNLLGEFEKYEIINVLCKYITIFHNLHESHIELALFTEELLEKLLASEASHMRPI